MATIKNFGIGGIGSDVQLGKRGNRIISTGSDFAFNQADGTTKATVTAASLTATTGGLVINSTSGTISIGGDTTASRHAAGVLKLDGTAAFVVPTGTTAQRPTASTGMMRINNDAPSASSVEFYNGTAWVTLTSSGSVSGLQDEIDAIETALGAAIDSSGVFVPSAFTGSAAGATSFTDAIQQVADAQAAKDTLDEIFPSAANGNVIYSSGGAWVQDAPGATSGVQAYDAGLAALAAKTSIGIMVQTGTDTYASRTLTAPAAGITITNPNGFSGNPTFALANDLAALEGLTTTGYIVRDGDGTATTRSIAGTAGNIVVTNGDGVASNTDIDLATVTQGASGDFVKVTLDTKGRVTGNTAVTTADITALVDGTYVNSSGDTMSGVLNMGSNKITGLAEPTASSDAATKNYVDNAVTGLSWKASVHTMSSTNITISNPGTATIGGHTLGAGDRVLLTGQSTASQNGIYIFDTSSTPLVRSADADTYQELNGAAVFVEQGTYADSGWLQTATLTSLSSSQTWVQFSGAGAYSGGTGIDITGNVISVNLGAGIAELPSDEIGIDLYDSANGALILTNNGTSRGTATGDKLHLMLDGSGGLAQTSSGLKISAAGVTNAMLLNSTLTLNADSGTQDPIALGETLLIAGTSTQGISTAVTGNTITINASNASDTQKGVAKFNSTSFTVTSGDVTLNTVDVAHGGTGATSFTAGELLYGNGTSALAHDPALSFVATGSDGDLQVGGATTGLHLYTDGTNARLSANSATANIVLSPGGTSGKVAVGGNSGASTIQSTAGNTLTISATTGALTLKSASGSDTVMNLGANTTDKVTVTGPTAAQYATSLADADLANMYAVKYTSGTVRTMSATVSLSANGQTTIGSIPVDSVVHRVYMNVVVASDSSSTTLGAGVGTGGSQYAIADTGSNDPAAVGLYEVAEAVNLAGGLVVSATVANAGTVGSASVVVEYRIV